MIQEQLMNILKAEIPGLTWSVDYRFADDHTGTVYAESPRGNGINNEVDVQRPSYMVYIRSSSWGYAETCARKVRQSLNGKRDFEATVDEYDKNDNVVGQRTYHVFYVHCVSGPMRIGVTDGVMEWSVNFDAELILKEES